jgi:dihydroneopterin aldolase
VITACIVALRNLEVLADIGVHHHEIGRPQPLVIHVALAVKAPERDDVSEVFDYGQLRAMAEKLSLERIVLIETFALRLARRCLDHPVVDGVTVKVDKPRGVPGSMASALISLGEPAPL